MSSGPHMAGCVSLVWMLTCSASSDHLSAPYSRS